MVDGLDPHSSYMTAEDFEAFWLSLSDEEREAVKDEMAGLIETVARLGVQAGLQQIAGEDELPDPAAHDPPAREHEAQAQEEENERQADPRCQEVPPDGRQEQKVAEGEHGSREDGHEAAQSPERSRQEEGRGTNLDPQQLPDQPIEKEMFFPPDGSGVVCVFTERKPGRGIAGL